MQLETSFENLDTNLNYSKHLTSSVFASDSEAHKNKENTQSSSDSGIKVEYMDEMGSRGMLGSTRGALSATQPEAVLLKVGRLTGAAAAGLGLGVGRLGFTSKDLTGAAGAFPKPPNGIATLQLEERRGLYECLWFY